MKTYIHELNEWPNFNWDCSRTDPLIAAAKFDLSQLAAKLETVGFDDQSEASLRVLTQEVVTTSEIEGEILDSNQVRSSIALKLGLPAGGLGKEDRDIEGIVSVVLDATQKCKDPLTQERLQGWHAALFPTGYSGLAKILVAQWRDDSNGPMQVVSGAYGNFRTHFEAPEALRLTKEMEEFFDWLHSDLLLDPLLKAGIAHLYFVTIHPFADGNGRIGRAISDYLLANADQMKQRYYSMSSQIRLERVGYYRVLENTQSGSLDITVWLEWFLECLIRAIKNAQISLQDILQKSRVWQLINENPINERQRKIINLILDGRFEGHLSSSKYAKITKCSVDTASRDLASLEKMGVFVKQGKARATYYVMTPLG